MPVIGEIIFRKSSVFFWKLGQVLRFLVSDRKTFLLFWGLNLTLWLFVLLGNLLRVSGRERDTHTQEPSVFHCRTLN